MSIPKPRLFRGSGKQVRERSLAFSTAEEHGSWFTDHFLRSPGYIAASYLPLLLENKALLTLASCALLFLGLGASYRQSWVYYKVHRAQRVHRACHSLWCVSGAWVGGVSDIFALTPENAVICSLGKVGNPIFFLDGPCHHKEECPGCCCTLLMACSPPPLHSLMLLSGRWSSAVTVFAFLWSSLSDAFIAHAGHADFWRHIYRCTCCCLIKAPSGDIGSPGFIPGSHTGQ